MVFKRAKILSLLFLVLFVYYFSFNSSLVSIEKTALIVAIGIDKIDEGYEVTAQIAIPEGFNKQPSNQESIISSKGKTLYEAISQIGIDTGWYPKLSFCNLVVLGESMLENNIMDAIDFILRSYKIEDSSILCASEGPAKEVLMTSSPLDKISGISLSKIFVRDYDKASHILTTSVKDFAIAYYSQSENGYMPLIKQIKTENNEKDDKAQQAAINDSETGNVTDNNKNKSVIYNAETCLLFNKGYMVGKIDGPQTLCYSLLKKNVNEAYITVTATNDDGKTGDILLNVLKSSKDVELIYKDQKPILKCKLKVWLKVSDASFSESIKTISQVGKLNQDMLFEAKKVITENILKVIEISKQTESDLFEVKNLLYRTHFLKYEKDKHSILKKFDYDIDVTCANYV